MNHSNNRDLADSLQDVKEAYLIAVVRRLISSRIPDGEILTLSRTVPLSSAIKKLKRAYFMSYLLKKIQRLQWK